MHPDLADPTRHCSHFVVGEIEQRIGLADGELRQRQRSTAAVGEGRDSQRRISTPKPRPRRSQDEVLSLDVLALEPRLIAHLSRGLQNYGDRLLISPVIFRPCPNGKSFEHEDYPKKLAWFDSLATHWSSVHADETAAVLCGDFNICPTDLDSHHSPEKTAQRIFHTADERARFQRLLDLGLVDTYRDLYPDTRMYSWWDYRMGAFHRNWGLRIDFVLATEAVRARARDVVIDREYRKKKDGLTASDHAPVWIDLD